jgi:hypothetical protein
MAEMPLKEVDKAEVLLILDNTIDIFLTSTEHAKRFPLPPDAFSRETPDCYGYPRPRPLRQAAGRLR